MVFYRDTQRYNRITFAGNIALRAYRNFINNEFKRYDSRQSNLNDEIIIEPLNNVDLTTDSGYSGLTNVDVIHLRSLYGNYIKVPSGEFLNLTEDKYTREIWLSPRPSTSCNTLVFYQNSQNYNRKTFAGNIFITAYPINQTGNYTNQTVTESITPQQLIEEQPTTQESTGQPTPSQTTSSQQTQTTTEEKPQENVVISFFKAVFSEFLDIFRPIGRRVNTIYLQAEPGPQPEGLACYFRGPCSLSYETDCGISGSVTGDCSASCGCAARSPISLPGGCLVVSVESSGCDVRAVD